MSIEQDILLMPQPDGLDDSPDTRPGGLLDQLLEEGAVCRDFVMAGATFQVKTTARFEPGQACFFRSAVSRGDAELAEAPWEPVFCNLTEELAAGERVSEIRLALARRALEVHLSLCHRVERQLEEKGDLATPSVLQSRVPWPYAAAILIIVAAAGAWYGLERWRVRPPGPPISARPAALAGSVLSLAEMPADPLESEDTRDPMGPGASADPAENSAPVSSAAIGTTHEIAVTPSRRPHRPRQKSELVERSPGAAPPRPTKSQPVPVPPSAQVTPEPADQPRDPVPSARVDTVVALPTLLAEIVPSEYRLLRLEPGARVYSDASIRISTIPQAYRQLPCVTTVSHYGDTGQGILLQLNRAARVFVAHDLRVKKKPKWLAAFRATGDTLQALEVDRGRTIEFAIYRRDVPAGAVALGSNTRTKALTRKVRGLVPGKSRLMYLVCLAEADGQVPPASLNSGRQP